MPAATVSVQVSATRDGQDTLRSRRDAFAAALRSAYSQLRQTPAVSSGGGIYDDGQPGFPCFYVLDGPVCVLFAAPGVGGRGRRGGGEGGGGVGAGAPWAAVSTSTWVLRRKLRQWVRRPTHTAPHLTPLPAITYKSVTLCRTAHPQVPC